MNIFLILYWIIAFILFATGIFFFMLFLKYSKETHETTDWT
ncbi:MAG: hypothetical protein K0Q99_1327, partial [Clostridia bacterium]|nr:hypothetical protein [Clostridia bacterium]